MVKWFDNKTATVLTESQATPATAHCQILICVAAMYAILTKAEHYLPSGFYVDELLNLMNDLHAKSRLNACECDLNPTTTTTTTAIEENNFRGASIDDGDGTQHSSSCGFMTTEENEHLKQTTPTPSPPPPTTTQISLVDVNQTELMSSNNLITTKAESWDLINKLPNEMLSPASNAILSDESLSKTSLMESTPRIDGIEKLAADSSKQKHRRENAYTDKQLLYNKIYIDAEIFYFQISFTQSRSHLVASN